MKHVSLLSVLSASLLTLGVYSPLAQASFVAHEWGTFTSVQGSDGEPLEGLQHAEEPLPSFVYGRDTGRPGYVSQFPQPRPTYTKRLRIRDSNRYF